MFESNSRRPILQRVRKLVIRNHINVAGIDYEAWARRFDERTAALINEEPPAFESGVRELLSELGTSHTGFYHSQPNESLPQHTINATLRATSGVREEWMFLDVFEAGPANLADVKPGDILEAVNGNSCMPPTFPSFSLGRMHTLTIRRGTVVREVKIEVPTRKGSKQRPPIVEPKAPIHRMISPGVGLLKAPYFPGAFGMRFARVLDAVIADLKRQGCDRLVVDLRGSIGGSLGFVRLASYFCPGQLAIGHSLTPPRLRSGYDPAQLPRVPMPRSRAELLVTLARFSIQDKSLMLLTQGLGDQPFHGRIVLLVNEWTNSAAEMVANFAAENRLATLVGGRTRGNVLGATNFRVGGGYWLRLPIFGWFTSQGRTLERTGVDPDIPVDISPTELVAGHDMQMIRAIEITSTL